MTNSPRAIGIIMDGNRRWAKERNLPTLEGHRQGQRKLEEVLSWTQEAGIEEVTVYAFSTENWNRSPEEVSYLLALFAQAFSDTLVRVSKAGVRIRFIGDRERFDQSLQDQMRTLENDTEGNAKGTLVLALSYGGRAEILAGIRTLVAQGASEITEEAFKDTLWSKGLLDPELIIRTGGDQRLSNFLTWQSVYSELFFTDTKWPDFSKEEFISILTTYASREQRHGK